MFIPDVQSLQGAVRPQKFVVTDAPSGHGACIQRFVETR